MKPLLLFDIDSTIFDVHRMMSDYVRPALQKALGCSESDFAAAEDVYRQALAKSTDFNPDEYLATLTKRFHAPFQPLKDIFFTDDWFQRSVYEDVVPVLEAVTEQVRPGIFSEGYEWYQLEKLQRSGLLKWFSPESTYIFRRKTSPAALEKLPPVFTFVDDKTDFLEALRAQQGVTGIWLNRLSAEKNPSFTTIHTLAELTAVLPQLAQ